MVSAPELLRVVVAVRQFKNLPMLGFKPAPARGIRLRNRTPRSAQQRFEAGKPPNNSRLKNQLKPMACNRVAGY